MKKLITTFIMVLFAAGLMAQNKFTYPLEIGKISISQGSITIYGLTSGSVLVKTNAAAGTGTVFQLPASNGTNGQFLQTNGSGVTSWQDASTGFTPASGSLTLSGADAITLTTTASTSVTLPTSGTLATTQNINDSLDQALAAAEEGVAMSKYAVDTTGIFNVLNFGAHADGTTNDASHFRAAIDAAETDKGTVYVPAGQYLISDSLILRPEVAILFDKNAEIFVPSGYWGSVFYSGSTGTSAQLLDCWVIGGSFDEKTTKYHRWTLIKFEKTGTGNDTYAMRNHFKNITVEGAKYVVRTLNTNDGWVNGNLFDDIWCWQNTNFLKTSRVAGTEFSANIFTNINFQAGDNSLALIDTLFGDRNQFLNINVWDWSGSARPAGPYIILSDDADNTMITMSALEPAYYDGGDGNYNTVITNKYTINTGFYYGNVTDNTPTDAEIDSIVGSTAAQAGFGFNGHLYDSSSGDQYKLFSTGSYWFYVKMTKAL